jgi:hypothetical protein
VYALDLHMASPVVLGWQQETGQTYMNISLSFILQRVNKLVAMQLLVYWIFSLICLADILIRHNRLPKLCKSYVSNFSNFSLFFIQWNLKLAVLLSKICMQHNLFLCLYFKVNTVCKNCKFTAFYSYPYSISLLRKLSVADAKKSHTLILDICNANKPVCNMYFL